MLAAPSRASEKLAYTGERATLARRRISRLLRWYLLYDTRAFLVLESGAGVTEEHATIARRQILAAALAPALRHLCSFVKASGDGRCLYVQVVSNQGDAVLVHARHNQ